MTQIYNRYTSTLEEEKTPGGKTLRWLYNTYLGHFFLKLLIRNPWMSKIMGVWLNTRFSKRHIDAFVKNYNICVDAFEKPMKAYKHFNDFFVRKFKPGLRPFNTKDNVICFPVDGRHLGFQSTKEMDQFFVKGETLNLKTLLGSDTLANQFIQGSMVISRLSLADYHRFHFPAAGIPSASRCINGYLYSVHPQALLYDLSIFTQNKRWICILKHDILGNIAIVEVGATGVGSTVQTYIPNHYVQKGDEKGYFLFGGSTVITLFESPKIRLMKDLTEQTQRGYELYAHCGDVLGTLS